MKPSNPILGRFTTAAQPTYQVPGGLAGEP
jgi:hypothetical protein